MSATGRSRRRLDAKLRARWFGAGAVLVAMLVGGGAAVAQLEEEDLPPSSVTEVMPLDEVRVLFEGAEATFRSADQPSSIAAFGEVVDLLQSREEGGKLEPEARSLLLASLSYRAQASFNLGDTEATERDLRLLLQRDPGYELDPKLVSPKLVQLLDAIRSQMVGRLKIAVDPPDAQVLVDGEERTVVAAGIPLLAGSHQVRVVRPGFGAVDLDVEVEPGKAVERELELQRMSAVVAVVTRPSGVAVEVDGQLRGTTQGEDPEGWELTGAAAAFPREDFSDPLEVDGLGVGDHVLTLSREGFRSQKLRIEVGELTDYRLGAVSLERTAGTLVLAEAPSEAEIRVDGATVAAARQGAETAITVKPGRRRVTVLDRGTVFETTVEVADRERKEVAVRMRPGVALLGVLGADDAAAEALRSELAEILGGVDHWSFLDRSPELRETMSSTGLRLDPLRESAAAGQRPDEAADWEKAQKASDEGMPGALRVLAVLTDDLVATTADLWWWPAAPAPPLPVRVRVAVDDRAALEALGEELDRVAVAEQPWLGVVLVDSEAAEGPVVAAVSPSGPAATAGLAVGDVVTEVDGSALASVSEAEARWSALGPGGRAHLTMRRKGAPVKTELILGSSPRTVSLTEPEVVYPAVAALAAGEAGPLAGAAAWIRGLDLAAVYLHSQAWEGAIRTLRGLEAPQGPGLGRGAVDYWLGVALSAAGSGYRPAAREALQRAARAEGARLFDRDGPWVVPRARARLATLGGD